jgi:hypothetical protein
MKNNLQISQNQLEKNIQKCKKLSLSVSLAFERVGLEPKRVEEISKDIVYKFNNVEEKHIIQAIKNGALGDYGRTFRMSTQEVSIWIKKFIEENPEAEPMEDRIKRLNKGI